ncbi:Glyoxalase/Bleomycin resistance protein/Dihydroxybiphenyl dioxygenase [Rhizodiscina lignyota]|uniref:Glyoxalase/Bleomycin resistance protein/Dihydroxybiphenyl dioxygenase n=1 Tax=Rhizodiscina lignyota TaxID=1504668 RepID=A0A9P4IQP1_9PEZI|nr:Glyoxalase/Bleomycin resistance protein/Dihydroxybiphenyl dioxygenase [Rhizodiscina lignyota]
MSEDSQPPAIAKVHHIKFPCSDIDAALKWYTDVLSARRIEQFDHFKADGSVFAYILDMPLFGNINLELRLDADHAEKQRGHDPVTWAVGSEADLESWEKWLTAKDVKHSRVLTGVIGWVLVFEDPDGRFLRLYTLEAHPKTALFDKDEYWLGRD